MWETGGKDIARAFDALARASRMARRAPGGDSEVRARLHRLAQEHRAWDRLADLFEGVAEQAESAPEAADLLMEVATIRGEQKRPREAEAQLRRVLGMLPNDPVARARLEELYRKEGRWVELAASLEERTDPRLGTAAPEAERPELLRELAGDLHAAAAAPARRDRRVRAAARWCRRTPQVLLQLAEIYASVGRWSKVIETLGPRGRGRRGLAEPRAGALRSIARI